MKNISGELLYLVLFAVVILGQYLIQWLSKGREAPRDDAQVEAEQQTWYPEPDELPAMQAPEPVHFVPSPLPRPVANKDRTYGSAMWGRAPASVQKRFSRAALLGSRQRTQDAVVASVILGPCRADVPHDNGR